MNLEDPKDKLAYALGVTLANNLMAEGLDNVDHQVFLAGFATSLDKGDVKIPYEDAGFIVGEYLQKRKQEIKSENAAAGQKFLEENGKRDGVTTLDSGLQYEVLTPGSGNSPSANDQVTTHYHGTLIDGTIFDSSVERGQPATFPVNGVIPGWVQALQLMQPGAKWKLFVPPHLAYGENGAGGHIGGNATLIFEVELLKVN